MIRLVQRLIAQAVDSRGADIHWEPGEQTMEVRFRTDGLLREIERVPASQCAAVVSHIKVMAVLNIAEKRLPQDGRISITVHGKDVGLRVATAPTLFGVVMRILDRQDVALDLDIRLNALVAQQIRLNPRLVVGEAIPQLQV